MGTGLPSFMQIQGPILQLCKVSSVSVHTFIHTRYTILGKKQPTRTDRWTERLLYINVVCQGYNKDSNLRYVYVLYNIWSIDYL